MRRAIRIHRGNFTAIVFLIIGAIVVSGYILLHQPAFTLFKNYYVVRVPFSTAAAVKAGQGQTINIAGVPVGQVGGTSLSDGTAVVTMDIYKKYAPIYRNATVLLRPRTPLKDMYLSLNPGTPSAGRVPNGGILTVGATIPDVDFSQVLSSLDADTRNYLLLLLSGGAQAFQRNPNSEAVDPTQSANLRAIFKRFAPLNRDTKLFSTLLAQRQQDIRESIHNFGQVTQALGSVDRQLTSLINSSNTNFKAISSQDVQLEQALALFPSTLQESITAFGKLRGFAIASGNANRALLPFAHELAPALKASRPLFADTTPVIRNQLRPFSVAVQPVARLLKPASASLAKGTPPLTKAFQVLNTLFNTLAYQPGHGQQPYLFWGSWLAHNADELARLQDAHGPTLQGVFMGACSELELLEAGLISSDPAIGSLIRLLNAPNYKTLPGVKYGLCPIA